MESEIQKFPKLFTADEASALLGVSAGTLAVWRSTKRWPLQFIKVGALVRYRESDLVAFIELRAQGLPKEKSSRRKKRSTR